MKSRILGLVVLTLSLAFGPGADKCDKGKTDGKGKPVVSTATARAIIIGVNAGVEEFARSVDDLGLPAEEARVLKAAFEEGKLSGPLAERAADFPNLSPAGRARLAADVAQHLAGSVSRLSAQGIGVKSEQAKQHLAYVRVSVTVAASSLRVYAATIEAGEDPDAAPRPTPSPSPR